MSRWPEKTLEERFMALVEKMPNKCWLWKGYCLPNGYGKYTYVEDERTVCKLTHRLAWEIFCDPIPKNLNVCHSCDVRYLRRDLTYRRCVNPNDLFLGTQSDNIRDMMSKGRMGAVANPGEKNGRAILTRNQVLEVLSLKGKRKALEIAEAFSISISTVWAIWTRRNWKELSGC